MKKRAVYSIIIIMLALTSCTIGGSFYMLNFSLTPNAKILSKDANSYPYMYRNYPFLRPWVDSLKQVNALKDSLSIRKAYSYTLFTSPHLLQPVKRR